MSRCPWILDGTARIQGSHVDMGAYEQFARKPGPSTTVELTFLFDGKYTTLTVDPVFPDTFTGSIKVGLETGSKPAHRGCHADLGRRRNLDGMDGSRHGQPAQRDGRAVGQGRGPEFGGSALGSKSVNVAEAELGHFVP